MKNNRQWVKFRDLPIGAKFRFSGEIEFPYSGFARGPWIKTGPRTYQHEKGEYGPLGEIITFKIGSINAQTEPVNETNPKKLTRKKARTILHHGTVRKHPLTPKQRKFFGARASGVPRKNPKGLVLIYKHVTRIEGTKGRNSAFPGQRFFHNFKRPFPSMYGTPDKKTLVIK